jgi:hypothetical protein
MGGLLPAWIPIASTLLPWSATLCRVLGGTGSTPCLLLSSRSGLLPHHTLALLPTPMGGSSTLRTEENPYGWGYYHPGRAPAHYFHEGPLSTHSSFSSHGGHYHPSGDIPSIVYGGGPFLTCPGEFPHASALVAPSHCFLDSLLHSSLVHKDHQSFSSSDARKSFLGPGHGPPLTPMIPSPPSNFAPPSSSTTNVLKLYPIKDAKAYLDALEIIEFYLREPEFSTSRVDGKLIMPVSNLKASCLWEGQLHLTVKDGTLHFLFENKGDIYNGCSFEMLIALNAFCRTKSVPNAFFSLLSIFNELQGNDEPIVAF